MAWAPIVILQLDIREGKKGAQKKVGTRQSEQGRAGKGNRPPAFMKPPAAGKLRRLRKVLTSVMKAKVPEGGPTIRKKSKGKKKTDIGERKAANESGNENKKRHSEKVVGLCDLHE